MSLKCFLDKELYFRIHVQISQTTLTLTSNSLEMQPKHLLLGLYLIVMLTVEGRQILVHACFVLPADQY